MGAFPTLPTWGSQDSQAEEAGILSEPNFSTEDPNWSKYCHPVQEEWDEAYGRSYWHKKKAEMRTTYVLYWLHPVALSFWALGSQTTPEHIGEHCSGETFLVTPVSSLDLVYSPHAQRRGPALSVNARPGTEVAAKSAGLGSKDPRSSLTDAAQGTLDKFAGPGLTCKVRVGLKWPWGPFQLE